MIVNLRGFIKKGSFFCYRKWRLIFKINWNEGQGFRGNFQKTYRAIGLMPEEKSLTFTKSLQNSYSNPVFLNKKGLFGAEKK